MVAPLIIGAGLGLLRLIMWLSSIVLVSSYVRDIVTKEPGEAVEISRDETIESIINDPDLSEEQKEKIILEFLKETEPGDMEDIKKYLPLAVVGFILFEILRGK